MRVIFQFVDAPADAVPAKLSDSTYMPPLQRLDRIFWICLVVSALLHTGGVIGAMNAPPPPKRKLTELPDRFAKMIIKKPPKVEPPKEKKKEKPKKDGEKKPSEKKAEKPAEKKAEAKPKKKPQTSAQKAARREQAREAVKQNAVFKALAIATSGGGAGVVFQADGDPRTDVSAALAASGGAGIAAADRGPGGPAVRGGSGGGGPVGIGEVGGVAVGGGGGKIANVRRRFGAHENEQAEDRRRQPGRQVRRSENRARACVQACYERELNEPSLKGKLVLEVTVGENGRAADIFVADNALNNAVANCIKGKMRSIRFPKPEGGEATFVSLVFASSG